MKRGKTVKKKTHVYEEEGIKLLAERLKAIRKQKGVTQEDLAFNSGLALSQIARIETAKLNPRISTVIRLAKTLDVDICTLLKQ